MLTRFDSPAFFILRLRAASRYRLPSLLLVAMLTSPLTLFAQQKPCAGLEGAARSACLRAEVERTKRESERANRKLRVLNSATRVACGADRAASAVAGATGQSVGGTAGGTVGGAVGGMVGATIGKFAAKGAYAAGKAVGRTLVKGGSPCSN